MRIEPGKYPGGEKPLAAMLCPGEKCDPDGTRAGMGSDRAADGGNRKVRYLPFPQCLAVGNIFLQQAVVKTGIAEHKRKGKVDAVCFIDFLDQHVIAVFGTAGLP